MTTPTVGLRALDVQDDEGGDIATWLLYPTMAPEQEHRHGPYALDVAEGADCEGRDLPLVAISHGNGGSAWTHRTTARALVHAGFVVALLEHPGNCRTDNSLAFTEENLTRRPRQLRRVIDAAFAADGIGDRLAPDVGVMGHSIGAYTALALAGGKPTSLAAESSDHRARPIEVTRDPRVAALALLAPATIWYREEGALEDVDVPVLMRAGEHDPHAPVMPHVDIVVDGLPDRGRVDHAVVPGAGHFAFQSVFPSAMTRPEFPPSQDPPGFDRAAYLDVLDTELVTFFRKHLVPR